MRRRTFLAGACVVGCASGPPDAPPPTDALLTPWRTLTGGFLAPVMPPVGVPARPTGMFATLASPAAVALRGADLLVADLAAGRLWRMDTIAGTMTGIAGAPLGIDTALALGPDGSAWVLDPPSRQVLRFGRDGRLLQSSRAAAAMPSPVALALADGGATLLLADGLGARWSEQRVGTGFVQLVEPQREGGQRVGGVDALVVVGDTVWVLDRLAGAVHRTRRDGRVLETLGRGELLQPVAIAADGWGRVYAADAADRALKLLQSGAPMRRIGAEALGVLRIGGIAIDDRVLAVADPVAGRVVLHRLGPGTAP